MNYILQASTVRLVQLLIHNKSRKMVENGNIISDEFHSLCFQMADNGKTWFNIAEPPLLNVNDIKLSTLFV